MDERWEGEKRLYEHSFYSILRRRTHIIDIRPEEGEIGYTTAAGDIHLAKEHAIINPLDDELKVMFRYGVFAHELLHQYFSDFSYLADVMASYKDSAERKVFALFANLVEDPAIEFFAPQAFGGEMLAALRYSINRIYQTSAPLEESQQAFGQLVSALVMFGDVGLIKGKFTFPEAQEAFLKMIPEFNAAVTNPNPRARIDAARKWAVLTRPLWRKDQDQLDELLKQAAEQMSGAMQGTGEPKEIPSPMQPQTDSDKRRQQAADAAKGQGGAGQDEGQKEEGEEKGHGSGQGQDQGKDQDQGSGSGQSQDTDQGQSQNASSSQSDCSSASQASQETSGNAGGTRSKAGSQPAEGRSGELDPNELLASLQDNGTNDDVRTVPSREDVDAVMVDVKREVKALADEEEDTLDIPVMLPKANGQHSGRISCANVQVIATQNDVRQYEKLLSKLSHDIKLLTASLKNVFRSDIDGYVRATSGRYSVKRDLTHTTVKIFDKRREKRNISDLAVMLLVDNSGSMCGNKIALARQTAVVLAETFKALQIPCYIMGFTADTEKAVEHRHYVSWKNTPQERAALMQIEASIDNDDGYSIRYATELLKRKKAEHKILFVISDGSPACYRYTRVDGIKDTSVAIQEAGRVATVFGIGIGLSRAPELKAMYKGAFIDVKNVNELPLALTATFKKIIKRLLV